MISPKIEEEFNKQINEELFSYYIYQSMAAYFTSINLNGFASWMSVQAQEEMLHAMKFYNHIHERDGRVKLHAIAEPQFEWKSPLDAFEGALAHERHITGRIHELVNLSLGEKDHASHAFLQWFVNEQVEEEASAKEIIDQLKLVGDSKGGMFMLDREMATRTFAPPPPEAGA